VLEPEALLQRGLSIMLKRDMKNSKETEVKHIKKVTPQPNKLGGLKPNQDGRPPQSAKGCIPVGD
jgi:hypothetical protein